MYILYIFTLYDCTGNISDSVEPTLFAGKLFLQHRFTDQLGSATQTSTLQEGLSF